MQGSRQRSFVPGTIPEEGHQRPSLKYLNRHVRKPVGSKWYDLGIDLLEVDDAEEVDRIQSENPKDITTCCTQMFRLWLRKQPTASWDQLISSLRQPGIELDHLATTIRKLLCKPSLGEQQPSVESTVSVETGPSAKQSSILPKTESTPLEFSETDDHMFIAFLRLTEKFQEEFEKAGVNVNTVKKWCKAYCSRYGASLSLTTSSMDELFEIIETKLPYHNILNLLFLQMLAEHSKLDCLIKSVDNYRKAFSSVKLSKLALITVGMIKEMKVIKEDKNCTELVTKLKKSDLTFGQLDGLFAEIAEKILYLHTGMMLPQWAEDGCVCIRWLIPSFLVEYAYHSACLNIGLFSNVGLISVVIGNYSVKLVGDADWKNPTQILCEHYSFCMENLQSSIICKMMEQEKLLSSADLHIILNTSMEYMRNCYIFEHVRHMETADFFKFLNILQKCDSQKHISEVMINALKSAGFEQFVKNNDDLDLEDDSGYSLTYSSESDKSFKITGTRRSQPVSKNAGGGAGGAGIFPLSNIALQYFDLFDVITELMQFEKVTEAIDNLMASKTHHVKLFSADFVKRIQQSTNIVILLRALFPYTNWYDHSMLRWLLQACNCSEGLRLLDEFNAQIDCALSIKDYPLPVYKSSYMTPDVSSTHTLLAIRCEQQLSSLSLQLVSKVKSIMLKVFDITEHACTLLTATNYTSAILYWQIPQSIVSLIYSKVQEHSTLLYDDKILEVAVYPNFAFSTGNVKRIWSLTYSSDMPRHTLQDKERDLLQKLTDVCGYYSPLETLHKPSHSNLQLKLDSTNKLIQKIQIQLSTVVKLISELKKTQHDLLQSTEKDINFFTLQNLFKQNITTLQQQFNDSNSSMKQVKTEMMEQSEKCIKDIENKVQSYLSQTLSKNIDNDLADNILDDLGLIKAMQTTMLKDLQHLYENEVNTEAATVQKGLPQVSSEKGEKVPFLTFMKSYDKLKESHYKLHKSKQKLEENNLELLHQIRRTEKQVEDVLKQMEAEKKEFEATIRHKAVLYEEIFLNLQRDTNSEDRGAIDVLKTMNSTLSETCERYMGKVTSLSIENDTLNDKIQKMEIESKEKDLEIQQLHDDITRLGHHVMNTPQDHLHGKKPSSQARTAVPDSRQEIQPPSISSQHKMKKDSGFEDEEKCVPSINLSLPVQYVHTSTTVKGRAMAINTKTAEEQHIVQYNTKPPAVPHLKHAKSKTHNEVGVSTGQTTELQAAFNKRKEMDPSHYEERVQQNMQKQRSKGELVKQHTYVAGQTTTVGDESELQAAFKKQQERSSYYTDSQDTH